MAEHLEIAKDGTLKLDKPVKLPEVLDVLIVGGGPAGTAAAFRAKELGLSALVIDFDDILKRIRDYAKDKLILPGFGGGDKMKFPKGGKLVSQLHFSPIDKDDMHLAWKRFYKKNNIPAHIGLELTELNRNDDGTWEARAYNHNTKEAQTYLAKHILIGIGRGVPRTFDIPGNLEGVSYRLTDAKAYVGAPCLVVGGGTSAAEAVITISNAKAEANDPTAVYWSYRGDKMPKVSKALADVFFEAYVGNGNIRHHPNSEPVSVVTAPDKKEYLSVRTDRRFFDDRPNETSHLEFPKDRCIACIGEDLPEGFLNSLGIYMATGGPKNKKRMVVTPHLETQQPNVYLIGDILSQAYFVTNDFDADPATFEEIKHRGNVKSALRDGVFVMEVIKQKIEGKKEIQVSLQDAEAAAPEKPEPEETVITVQKPVESTAPPAETEQKERQVEDTQAMIVRVLPGDVEENEYPLNLDGITTIGRKDCDITFPDDTLLSDEHASIAHSPEGFFLRDDGSKTGVFLRATEARHLEVAPGDLVRAGKQFLLFSSKNGDLFCVHYDHTGKEVNRYPLTEKFAVFGREAPDVTLDSNDKTLSRRHLAVATKDGKFIIKDLKSANGTYLKVRTAVKLEHGDQFRVGQQVFNFSLSRDAVLDTGHVSIPSTVFEPPKEKPEKAPPPPADEKPEKEEQPAAKAPEGGPAVTFKNSGQTFPVESGQTICEIAEQNGVSINAECHAGICGSDPIRILSGKENLDDISDQEVETLEEICDLDPSECRMACMTKPKGPVEVEIIQQ